MALDLDASRPLRRDAERNRRRLLEAAAAVFAEQGLDVPMDAIARAAGVGVGTLYRRFSSRDALIEALFEDRLAELVRAATEAERDPDAWHGLTSFLERSIAVQAADRGLKQMLLSTGHARHAVAATRDALRPRLEALVARAAAEGELRPGVTVTDLGLVNVMLAAIVDYTQEVAPDAWRRVLALLLDGLRARRPEPAPLPGAPLSDAQIDAAMDCWRPR